MVDADPDRVRRGFCRHRRSCHPRRDSVQREIVVPFRGNSGSRRNSTGILSYDHRSHGSDCQWWSARFLIPRHCLGIFLGGVRKQ